jgi:hypothetical protein
VALNKVIELSPAAQDAFLYKARVNRYIQTNESYIEMSKAYDKYIEIVTGKGAEETAKQRKTS